MTDTHKERFLVQFSIEDSVEILLQPNASERAINKAARDEIYKQISKSHGCPFDIQLGRYEGPY